MESEMTSLSGLKLENREDEIVGKIRALCDAKGRETQPKKSALLLHQLGIIYSEKSHDKICLLQSAALFNAALARNPNNVREIHNDLRRLCSHVLKLSNAKDAAADLVEVSETVFEKVRSMRESATAEIENLNLEEFSGREYEIRKVNFIETLQNQITLEYQGVMKDISDYCIETLGEPPCLYSHVGMGSLARKEVTPFSDFESIIVLNEGVQHNDNYPEILEYFRWFTVMFQIIILNFGETIIPSVAVPSLNDFLTKGGDWFFDVHTPRGICFDGLMPHASKTPLGRQQETKAKPWKTELIKPVSMMLSYLTTENDIKNGYHLADILATTCYVSGDRKLCEEFRRGANLYLKSNENSLCRKQLLDQIKEDLDSFAVFDNLVSAYASNTINTKRMIYRSSTIFISTLGKIHRLESSSCFDIIRELEKNDILTAEASHNLKFAVAVACDVRLSVYMKRNSQSETITIQAGEDRDLGLDNIVTLEDIVDYFKITFCLQRNMRKGTRERYTDSMREFGKDVEVCISYCLHQYVKAVEECKELRESYISQTGQGEKVLACTSVIKECLFHLERYDEALAESHRELSQLLETDDQDQSDIAKCRRAIGKCLFKLFRFSEAVEQHKYELEIRQKLPKDTAQDTSMAECCQNIAYSYFKLKEFADGLFWFQKERCTYDTLMTTDSNKLAICFMNIAGCCFRLQRYGEAMHNYEHAKDIRESTSANRSTDEDVAECFNKIGHCLNKMGKTSDAVGKYQEELRILEKINANSPREIKIQDCKANIAGCYLELRQFYESLTYYIQILGTETTNTSFSEYLGRIGSCLFELGRFEEGLDYHTREFDIRILQPKNDKLATCLHHIACDLYSLGKVEESMTRHQEEMNLRRELSDGEVTLGTARCFNKIASCFVAMQQFDNALFNYQEELSIRQQLDLDNHDRGHIADTMHNIASCLYKLGRIDDAMVQLQEAMSFRQHS